MKTRLRENWFIRVTSLSNCIWTEPKIRAQRNASQSSTHMSTSNVQRTLDESGFHGWIAAKQPRLRKNNRNRIAWNWPRNTWNMHQTSGYLNTSHEKSKAEKAVVSTWWWSPLWRIAVMEWACFAGDHIGYNARFNTCTAFCSNIPDPKHTSMLCKGYWIKKESDWVLNQMIWLPQSDLYQNHPNPSHLSVGWIGWI